MPAKRGLRGRQTHICIRVLAEGQDKGSKARKGNDAIRVRFSLNMAHTAAGLSSGVVSQPFGNPSFGAESLAEDLRQPRAVRARD